jgi:hypothetical protein
VLALSIKLSNANLALLMLIAITMLFLINLQVNVKLQFVTNNKVIVKLILLLINPNALFLNAELIKIVLLGLLLTNSQTTVYKLLVILMLENVFLILLLTLLNVQFVFLANQLILVNLQLVFFLLTMDTSVIVNQLTVMTITIALLTIVTRQLENVFTRLFTIQKNAFLAQLIKIVSHGELVKNSTIVKNHSATLIQRLVTVELLKM